MDILQIIDMIFQYVFMLSSTCMQTLFYTKTIGFNQKWKGLRLAFIVLLVALITTVLQVAVSNITAITWASFLVPVTFVLYPVLFWSGMLIERILFGFASCAMFMLSAILAKAIMFSSLAQIWSGTSWQLSLIFLALLIAINIFFVLGITRLNTKGKRYMPRNYWIGLNLCFIIISVGLISVDYLNVRIKHAERLRTYLFIFSMVFIVIWLLLYFVFYFICRYFAKVSEANALAIQNDMIERYMLRKQETDERIKVLSHDLKHSLVGWRKLAEEKGDENSLISIAEYERQLSSSLLINVENETANAIINQKAMEAEQAGVAFQVDGAFQPDMLVSKLDLCSLLGNLLDNAIEAAAQIQTEALRRVKLSIRRKGSLLILMAENGYAVEPIIEDGFFVTRKKDKNLHAIGTRSIRHVVEKYDGVVNNSYENNWFRSSVMVNGYLGVLSDEN